MSSKDNDASLLLDVSRLVWRRWSGTRPTGIDRICLAWLEHYAGQSQAVIVHRRTQAILPESASRALFRLLLKPERSRRDVSEFRRNVIALGLRQGIYLRDRLPGRGRLWLNPGHTGLDVPELADWCRRRHLRPIYLVHDLIPITHPQFCRAGEEERHRRRMRTVLESAAGVVANSAHTLASYEEFACAEGMLVSPTVVAWPGTPELSTAAPQSADEPTFVVLGTIEGRKNHRLLLSVWQQLLRHTADDARIKQVPRLVIIGRRGWQADDVFDLLDNVDFKGRVSEMGPLDDASLANLLSKARALLFPTLAEGFGMPLVEALAAGVPVIASDLEVFREIGQGVPDLLPAGDPEAWQQAILDFARPLSARRAHQLERLTRFQPPSWKDHFKQVDTLIEALSR